MNMPETLSERAAEEVRAMLARRRLSGSELARRLDVSHTWVTNRLSGHREISLNDLQRIAAALDVEISELLPAPARRDSRSNPDTLHLVPRPRPAATGTTCDPPTGPPPPEMPAATEPAASRRIRRPVVSYGHVTDGVR